MRRLAMARRRGAVLAAVAATVLLPSSQAGAQTTTINGTSFQMRSSGAASGSAWSLGSSGYVGTYITVPAGGATVNFTLNAQQGATGAGNPHVNLSVADTKIGFDLTSTSATNYNTSAFLPGGTYFVRTERNYVAPGASSSRSAILNSLTIGGATVSTASTDASARAAADTYIQNFRRGNASVALTGPGNIPLLPGTQVNVDLKRHAFNFGTAVPGSTSGNVSAYLGSGGTAQQTNYQQRLLQNFNSVVPENAGKWSNNEATRDVVTMTNVDTILNYAQTNNLRSRMHNHVWGNQQPSWVSTHLTNGSAGSLTTLRNEVTQRAGYYVGDGPGGQTDRSLKYTEIDIYNESYHTGSAGGSTTYWNRYGANGIADMYREARDAIAASGASAKTFVNEYNVYADGGSAYAAWYTSHIESLRNAGHTSGYGEVVGGVGTQYYVNPPGLNEQHSAARMTQVLQNLSVQGLPIALTEFGVKSGADQITAAGYMDDSVRLLFGHPDATGFMMWGHVAENGGGNLFAPAAAFYNVNTANWNSWTITEAGKRWQDLLGIADWDGDPNDGWDTNLNAVVNPDGSIAFTGFYGDYNIGGQAGNSNLSLVKGTGGYSLSLALPPQWSVWNASAGGPWGTGSNWTGGSPDAVDQTAHFGGVITAPRTVSLAAPVTVGQINFDNVNAYTLAGPGTITMSVSGPEARLNVATGSHTITAPLVLADDLAVNISGVSSVLTVADLRPSASQITKNGPGTLAANNVRAAGLAVNAGTVSITPNGGDDAVSQLGTVALAPSATLDLNDNDLIVTAGSRSSIEQAIVTARNGGAWDQPGITSSSARSHAGQATTLGVLSGSEYISTGGSGTFGGVVVSASDVLVKYTWYGDSDFNGSVDFDDYVRIDGGYNGSMTGWLNGDFDLSGAIDFDDYVLIDLAYNSQDGTLRRAQAFISGDDRSMAGMHASPALARVREHFEAFGVDFGLHFLAAVPEPGVVLSGSVALALGLSGRRSRVRRSSARPS